MYLAQSPFYLKENTMHERHTRFIDCKGTNKTAYKEGINEICDAFEAVCEHDQNRYYNIMQVKDTYKHFESKKEAENYLYSLVHEDDDYSYCCTYNFKRSGKYVTLSERLVSEKAKLEEYTKQHSVKRFKADYIGCPMCGSKLAKGFIRSEACPLCGTELRSKTTLDTIRRYVDNIRKLEKEIKEEEKVMASSRTGKFDTKSNLYLICIDTHC